MQQLLQHFSELTLHPKNAEELKGLILQLAVQGKLTGNWRADHPDVEPASELLKRIEKEKAQLIKEKKIKMEKPLINKVQNWDNEESLINWTNCNLGEAIVLISGRDLTPNDYSDTKLEFPYLTGASQIKGDEIVLSRWTDNPKVVSIKGDLLVSCKGTIGKTVINNVGEIHIARQIMAIRIYDLIEIHFVKIFIDSYVMKLQELSKSMIPGISREDILDANFFLPPFEEQKAIVEVVNQLFTEVEQLEELTISRITLKEDYATSALQRLTASDSTNKEWSSILPHFSTFFTEKTNIKKLRETILQLAVQGKLTTKWRKANPDVKNGSKLLKYIAAKKQKLITEKKIKKNPKWSGPIEISEKNFTIPDSWDWLRLGDLCELKNGHAFKSVFFTREPAPYVLTTPGNFHENGGFRDREAKRKYYNGPVNSEFILKVGDLIIPMTEQAAGLLGSPAFIPDDGRVYLHNQRLGKMSFDSNTVLPEFAFLFFNSTYFRKELARTCTGMKVRHTSPDRILCVPFPICPITEQLEVVRKVNSLMALCDALGQHMEQSQIQIEQLMQSCLKEVFEHS